MKEIIIPLDPVFAEAIDARCTACLDGLTDSRMQLDLLRSRQVASPYPLEKKALDAYMQQCQRCSAGGKGPFFIDSLTATRSCDYRTGIEGEIPDATTS